jgi:hypothetical protein
MSIVSFFAAQPWMRDLFARADIAFCDGTGVQLAACFLIGRVRGGRRRPTGLGLCWGNSFDGFNLLDRL